MEIARRESGGGPVRLGALTGTGDAATVTGFAIDHRKVAPGTVFGAFQGTRVNGEDFISAAIAGGAIAVVARPEARVEGAIHIADDKPRAAFARPRPGERRVGKECVRTCRSVWASYH